MSHPSANDKEPQQNQRENFGSHADDHRAAGNGNAGTLPAYANGATCFHEEGIPLPGISRDYLERAHVRRCPAGVVREHCGIFEAGVLFPYYNFNGEPVADKERGFCRVRLDHPIGGKKYHQRGGTPSHAYLPPSIWQDQVLEPVIYLVEGEKKALSMAEAGFCAVGLGGFFNFRGKDGGLVPELQEIVGAGISRATTFVFLGDQDVLTNFQFFQAACQLRELLGEFPFSVTCIPPDASGKGIDDCRQALGEEFVGWCQAHLQGIPVERNSEPAKLALQMIETWKDAMFSLKGADRESATVGLVRLAAAQQSSPWEQQRTLSIAQELSGTGISVLKKMMVQERRKLLAEVAKLDAASNGSIIDLSQQSGLWTRQALESIGQDLYIFAGNICDLKDGKLVAHDAASLVSVLDSPERCCFITKGKDGTLVNAKFSETLARLVIGAARGRNLDVLRTVELVVQTPVLVWNGDGPEIIASYSKQHQILAAGTGAPPPPVDYCAKRLLEILGDFQFASDGDKGRALAFLLTPALVRGGFLGSGRAPFFFIRKDQSGAGAGTFMKMLAAIYHSKPHSVTPRDERTAKEDISKKLLEGASIVYFDNMRGSTLKHLPFLESLLTEPCFPARALYVQGDVDVRRCVFGCTSNGAMLSDDLSRRTVEIVIRKNPDGYAFRHWPKGELLDHIEADCPGLLCAIYGLVEDWAKNGRPDGPALTGFRYPQWEKACAWILHHHFNLPLLDADHGLAQKRLADPEWALVRSIFQEVINRGIIGELTATSLVRAAMEAQIIPANSDEHEARLHLGRILSSNFPQEGCHIFANEFYVLLRHEKGGPAHNYESMKKYAIRPIAPGTPA